MNIIHNNSLMAKDNEASSGLVIRDNEPTNAFAEHKSRDVPPGENVAMAFEIIWTITSIIQLVYILKNLKVIPSAIARGPYIMLAGITLTVTLYHGLYSILVRVYNTSQMEANAMVATVQFFWVVDTAFRPAVVLYLVHQRGNVLQAIENYTRIPLSTQLWKRILDWVLVALAFVAYIGWMGTITTYRTIYNNPGTESHDQGGGIFRAALGLAQAGLGLTVLLCINVVASLIIQSVKGDSPTMRDLVMRRLVMIVLPLFILYAIELLVFEVYSMVMGDNYYNGLAFTVVYIVVDSVLRVAITAGIISTMTLPNVFWTPQQVPDATSKELS